MLAKCIFLSCIVILFNVLANVSVLATSYVCATMFASIDLCVNLLCLYLQFAFAENHHRKRCRCLDSRCESVVLSKKKRIVLKEALRKQMETAVMLAVIETSSISSTGGSIDI